MVTTYVLLVWFIGVKEFTAIKIHDRYPTYQSCQEAGLMFMKDATNGGLEPSYMQRKYKISCIPATTNE